MAEDMGLRVRLVALPEGIAIGEGMYTDIRPMQVVAEDRCSFVAWAVGDAWGIQMRGPEDERDVGRLQFLDDSFGLFRADGVCDVEIERVAKLKRKVHAGPSGLEEEVAGGGAPHDLVELVVSLGIDGDPTAGQHDS